MTDAADVVIVGAGVAGLVAACRFAADLDVAVVDKGTPGQSGSSPWAQGGVAVAVGPDDSAALHAADTVRAGDGLADPAAAEVLAREAPDRLADLLRWGARFDGRNGARGNDLRTLHLAREGGQSVARSVHAADATGAEIVRVLRARAAPRVRRAPGAAFALGGHDRVRGVWLHTPSGVRWLGARAVLLATGGCGGLYAATTNQASATGDGVAVAARAGAAIRDLEFVQFHPTGLATPGTWRLLLTEALRGAGARLVNAAGESFLAGVHPDAELAPRHVVTRAIVREPGGAWLDATGLGAERLENEFPNVLAGARDRGFDLATQAVPVTPAAHYMVGGVRTDLDGRTTRTGLFAAGEVASSGVHGANRMAGNSLAEALVFGVRAANAIAAELATSSSPGATPTRPRLVPPRHGPDVYDRLIAEVRASLWRGAGPLRDAASLQRCLGDLERLREQLGSAASDDRHLELDLALTTARLLTEAAVLRTETRGGHVRDDFPRRGDLWDHVHLERSAAPTDAAP